MKIRGMIIGLVCALVLAGSVVGAPQEPADYSWGTVVEVSENSIVLEEYDFEADDYRSVSYTVSPEAVLHNIASLSEVAPGDDAEVGFVVEGETRVAVSLYVEKDPVRDEG